MYYKKCVCLSCVPPRAWSVEGMVTKTFVAVFSNRVCRRHDTEEDKVQMPTLQATTAVPVPRLPHCPSLGTTAGKARNSKALNFINPKP